MTLPHVDGFPVLRVLRSLRPTYRPIAPTVGVARRSHQRCERAGRTDRGSQVPRMSPRTRPKRRCHPGDCCLSCRSSGEASSSTPAASPGLRRRPSPWPRRRQCSNLRQVTQQRHLVVAACAPPTGPDPSGSSRPPFKRLLPLVRLPYTFLSRSPSPTRLTVPDRLVLRRGCLPSISRTSGSRLPPSSIGPLRRTIRRGLAPRTAREARRAHNQRTTPGARTYSVTPSRGTPPKLTSTSRLPPKMSCVCRDGIIAAAIVRL